MISGSSSGDEEGIFFILALYKSGENKLDFIKLDGILWVISSSLQFTARRDKLAVGGLSHSRYSVRADELQ